MNFLNLVFLSVFFASNFKLRAQNQVKSCFNDNEAAISWQTDSWFIRTEKWIWSEEYNQAIETKDLGGAPDSPAAYLAEIAKKSAHENVRLGSLTLEQGRISFTHMDKSNAFSICHAPKIECENLIKPGEKISLQKAKELLNVFKRRLDKSNLLNFCKTYKGGQSDLNDQFKERIRQCKKSDGIISRTSSIKSYCSLIETTAQNIKKALN